MPLTEEQKQQSITTLKQMTELLGFPVEVSEKEGAEEFTLSVKTSEAGRLIGRKGHYLMSLELLLNRILRKRFEQLAWVELDVDGYQKKQRPPRGGRNDADAIRLQQMALDAAKEVKRWGEVRKLGPFTARERREIHLALRSDTEIVTESEPEQGGNLKTVVIRRAGPQAAADGDRAE